MAIESIDPALRQDLLRMVDRYGAGEVLMAAKAMIQLRPGRKAANDLSLLLPYYQQDAVDWLAGKRPLEERSNNSIANAIAEAHPGQSRESTARRIRGKLAQRFQGRRWYMLVKALAASHKNHPHELYGRALFELDRLDDDREDQTWWRELRNARATIAEYRAIKGEAPIASMSFDDIERCVRANSRSSYVQQSEEIAA